MNVFLDLYIHHCLMKNLVHVFCVYAMCMMSIIYLSIYLWKTATSYHVDELNEGLLSIKLQVAKITIIY